MILDSDNHDPLKPCPFCGGEVDIQEQNSGTEYEYWDILCKTEGCIMEFGFEETTNFPTIDEIVSAWNRRE